MFQRRIDGKLYQNLQLSVAFILGKILLEVCANCNCFSSRSPVTTKQKISKARSSSHGKEKELKIKNTSRQSEFVDVEMNEYSVTSERQNT
jgi:hypothetical protein